MVTNNHVVAEATSIVAVDLSVGKSYPVRLVGRDPSQDIAVIQLQGAAGLPVEPLGDSDQLRIGDRVAAIGNAGGRGGEPTVTTGSVSALRCPVIAADGTIHQIRLHGMIQVNASVPAGDSGGALVDSTGVIGMDTAANARFGFAIPINTVLATAHRLGGPSGSQPHDSGPREADPATRSLAARFS